MEVALDLALQCSPDHPWLAEHPEWFTVLPDGTVARAGSPSRRWQDVCALNFDRAPAALRAEILRMVLFWVALGVKIFRVDNPHTKPADLWHRLIWEVKRRHPEVLFLAEAFTRPAPQRGLSKVGFSQTLTYFIWRTGKAELEQFGAELVELSDYLRPNLFPTTHDVLHETLQRDCPATFAIRATLAATISPSWGIYSGYELYEHQALRQGSREYRDSEKFELRPRDHAAALAAGRSLAPWLTLLNRIRRDHPALQQLRTLRFHDTDDDALLAYSKTDPGTGDVVICVVTLDPEHAREGTVRFGPVAGLPDAPEFAVRDEVTGECRRWGRSQRVRLDPAVCVARIVSLSEGR